jgi:hypothetical protein
MTTWAEDSVGFKRDKLREMFSQCSKEEQQGFFRFYPSIDAIPEYKLTVMYDLFARTVEAHKGAMCSAPCV